MYTTVLLLPVLLVVVVLHTDSHKDSRSQIRKSPWKICLKFDQDKAGDILTVAYWTQWDKQLES